MSVPYAEVIGDPVAHSKSPMIHNFWLAKLGIAAEYRKTHVRPEDLAEHLARRRGDAGWRGCSITMPHKQAVMPLLDTVSRSASRIGAVNCVYVQAGRLIGENTDVDGVVEPLLLEANRIGGYADHVATYVQIIGAGGAARAAAAQPLYERWNSTTAMSPGPRSSPSGAGCRNPVATGWTISVRFVASARVLAGSATA